MTQTTNFFQDLYAKTKAVLDPYLQQTGEVHKVIPVIESELSTNFEEALTVLGTVVDINPFIQANSDIENHFLIKSEVTIDDGMSEIKVVVPEENTFGVNIGDVLKLNVQNSSAINRDYEVMNDKELEQHGYIFSKPDHIIDHIKAQKISNKVDVGLFSDLIGKHIYTGTIERKIGVIKL